MLGLGTVRIAGKAALLAERAEVLASGQQLVHIGLVAGVEDDAVPRRLEDPVDSESEFHNAEVRTQVSTRLRLRW